MADFNDGAIPYGSRLVTMFRAAVNLGTYVLENVTVNRPSHMIKRYNQIRQPNGSVGIDDFVEASAVAQLATITSTLLRNGDTFSDTFDAALGAETFIVAGADQPESQGEYKKQSLKFIKKYN